MLHAASNLVTFQQKRLMTICDNFCCKLTSCVLCSILRKQSKNLVTYYDIVTIPNYASMKYDSKTGLTSAWYYKVDSLRIYLGYARCLGESSYDLDPIQCLCDPSRCSSTISSKCPQNCRCRCRNTHTPMHNTPTYTISA